MGIKVLAATFTLGLVAVVVYYTNYHNNDGTSNSADEHNSERTIIDSSHTEDEIDHRTVDGIDALNMPALHNNSFNQTERCLPNSECSLSFFLLKAEMDREFSLLTVDVLELNQGARVSSLDAKSAESSAILGEKFYLGQKVDVGHLYSYLDTPTYGRSKAINEQPAHYLFSPHRNFIASKTHIRAEPGMPYTPPGTEIFSLSLPARSTIILAPGNNYYINDLDAEADSQIVVRHPEGHAAGKSGKELAVFVYGKITHIPKILNEADARITMFILNTNSLQVGKFDGLLVCPYCFLTIDSSDDNNVFKGQVYSRSLKVMPNSKIIHHEYDLLAALKTNGTLQNPEDITSEGSNDNEGDKFVALESENPIFDSGDVEIDKMLERHFKSKGGYGEPAKTEYSKSFDDLKKHDAEAIEAIYSEFEQLNPILENQFVRWSLVQTAAEMESEHALEMLTRIANSDNNSAHFGYVGEQARQFDMGEAKLRFRAISGLTSLAANGSNGAIESLYYLAESRTGVDQYLAAHGYLQSGDAQELRKNLENILPSSLLNDLVTNNHQ